MFYFKLILLCSVEGGWTWNPREPQLRARSLPTHVILVVTLSLWLSLSSCMKWKYCTNLSLNFFPSLTFYVFLFYFLTFPLPTSKHFLIHGTEKDLGDPLIFISHLAQERTDWEADGRCCFGRAWTRAQGFSSSEGSFPCAENCFHVMGRTPLGAAAPEIVLGIWKLGI